ncbi:hypothetical protein VTJ49DRAFT_6146 [Mycothermus thermophilus]|uniref:Uncharacterized protein n=1 Tax=Humicola insolens TaxID=85995 RepID=A0ABR3V2W3_HUMIN
MELAIQIPHVLPEHCSATSSPDQHHHHHHHHRSGYEDQCAPQLSSTSSSTRQPLQESTVNIQHHPSPHMAWHAQQQQQRQQQTQQDVLSPLSPAPGLMPPIFRAQSSSSLVGAADYGLAYASSGSSSSSSRSQSHQHQKLQHPQQQHGGGSRRMKSSDVWHPLLPFLGQAYQNYRKKQEDKPDQKWPIELEVKFIDGKSCLLFR